MVGQLVEGPAATQRLRRVRRNYTPYLLLLPGLAWLVVFFVCLLYTSDAADE